MNDDLVTVATSQNAIHAESIRLLLSQEGIKSFAADENLVNTNWFLSLAVGYIKIQVLRSQADAAIAILKEHPQSTGTPAIETDEDESGAKCLSCGKLVPQDTDVCPACGWSYEGLEEEPEGEADVQK